MNQAGVLSCFCSLDLNCAFHFLWKYHQQLGQFILFYGVCGNYHISFYFAAKYVCLKPALILDTLWVSCDRSPPANTWCKCCKILPCCFQVLASLGCEFLVTLYVWTCSAYHTYFLKKHYCFLSTLCIIAARKLPGEIM